MTPRNLNNPTEIMAYVHWFLNKYKSIPANEIEDVASECYLRIYQVLPKFDKNRGKLSTFLFYCCQSTANYHLKKIRKKRKQTEIMPEKFEIVVDKRLWKSAKPPEDAINDEMDGMTSKLVELPLI